MNDYITIKGGKKLKGTVKVSSAKNAAVAILPSVVLSSEIVKLYDVPNISDIDSLVNILKDLNVKVETSGNSLTIDPTDICNVDLTDEKVSKLRASYYFMGALLSRFKKVKAILPGGCNLGDRPIDLHLKGFKELGAKVNQVGDVIEIWADELKGAEIYLDFASVGATINIMLAAVFAQGKTTIINAAKEPEIIDLSSMLNKMGANIKGVGTSEITIEGVKRLKGCVHEIIPDRIEAGTYIIMASAIGEDVTIENIIPQHLDALFSKLEEIGVNVEVNIDSVRIRNSANNYKPVNLTTRVYPGFPTDLQQPFTTLLTQVKGQSMVTEEIYPKRFKHCEELNKMQADIDISNVGKAIINGGTKLIGNKVTATDLRCGAALVLAGLLAEGETVIFEAKHIYRGYDSIVDKLKNLGADIS